MEGQFLSLAWGVLAVLAVGTSRIGCIREWTSYGVGRAERAAAATTACAAPTVPRSWFWHMYVVALVAQVAFACLRGRSLASDLFTLHVARRLLECFFVQRPRATLSLQIDPTDRRNAANLPLGVYLGGFGHYIFAAWTFSLCAPSHSPSPVAYSGAVLAVGFFALQFWAHRALADLRSEDPSEQAYRLPAVPPFTTLHLTHPHYLADAGVYVALTLVAAGLHDTAPFAAPAIGALALWSTANLCVTGAYARQTYVRTFGAAPLAAARLDWAVLPPLC
jgi:hypothetical protein